MGASLFLSLFLVVSSLAAQEANPSLADIARQQREHKKDQAKPAKVLTNDDVRAKDGGQEGSPSAPAGEKSAAEAKSSPPVSNAPKVMPPPECGHSTSHGK